MSACASILVTVQQPPTGQCRRTLLDLLPGGRGGARGTASDSASVLWTTSGTGSFASPSSLATSYTPSLADVTAGFGHPDPDGESDGALPRGGDLERHPHLHGLARASSTSMTGTSDSFRERKSHSRSAAAVRSTRSAAMHSRRSRAPSTAVTAGGTVNVAAGSYVENVTIAKSLSLVGPQAGVDARGRVGAEATISPAVAGTPAMNVAFSGTLTIDGFWFSGGTAFGLIMTTVGPNNGMQIVNDRFSGYTGAALFLNRGGADITIDKNVMDGSSLPGSGQALFCNGPQNYFGLWITNNWFINNTGRYGYFVDGNHNVTESATRAPLISGNLFDNNIQGMNLGSRSFGTFAAPVLGPYGGTISENTFSNNAFDGIQAGIQHVLVTRNTFTNNGRTGVALTAFSNLGLDRGAQNSVITENVFSGNVQEDIFFTSVQAPGLISTNRANGNRFGSATAVTYNEATLAEQETIDCSANWWGSNTGPTLATHPGGVGSLIAGAASSKVDFTPWLNSGTDTALLTAGFQGDVSSIHVDDDSIQSGAAGRVTEGVDRRHDGRARPGPCGDLRRERDGFEALHDRRRGLGRQRSREPGDAHDRPGRQRLLPRDLDRGDGLERRQPAGAAAICGRRERPRATGSRWRSPRATSCTSRR